MVVNLVIPKKDESNLKKLARLKEQKMAIRKCRIPFRELKIYLYLLSNQKLSKSKQPAHLTREGCLGFC